MSEKSTLWKNCSEFLCMKKSIFDDIFDVWPKVQAKSLQKFVFDQNVVLRRTFSALVN